MPLKSSLLCVKLKKVNTKPSQTFRSQDSFTAACLIPSRSLMAWLWCKYKNWICQSSGVVHFIKLWSFKSGRERLVIGYQYLELNSDLLPYPETKATSTLCTYKVEAFPLYSAKLNLKLLICFAFIWTDRKVAGHKCAFIPCLGNIT